MLKIFLRYKFQAVVLLVSFVLVLGGWLWAYFALRNISEPLVIEYSNMEGIERIGYQGDLARVAVFGLLAVFVNFLISVELEKRLKFWGQTVAAVTLFLGLLIFIYFAAIIGVN